VSTLGVPGSQLQGHPEFSRASASAPRKLRQVGNILALPTVVRP